MNAPRMAMVTAALTLVGCMAPVEDIPLATASIESVTPCMGCRDAEAVTVTLSGSDALANALVVVHDTRLMLDRGQRPSSIVRADARGRWQATLRGLRVPGRAELPIHAGDTLEVFQKDGDDGDASTPYRIAVPSPERNDTASPPLLDSDFPQAADPWPSPSGR